jgi:hypothetical protein
MHKKDQLVEGLETVNPFNSCIRSLIVIGFVVIVIIVIVAVMQATVQAALGASPLDQVMSTMSPVCGLSAELRVCGHCECLVLLILDQVSPIISPVCGLEVGLAVLC